MLQLSLGRRGNILPERRYSSGAECGVFRSPEFFGRPQTDHEYKWLQKANRLDENVLTGRKRKKRTFETTPIVVFRVVRSLLDDPIGLLPCGIFHSCRNNFKHPN